MRGNIRRALPYLAGVVLMTGVFVRPEPAPYEYGMAALVLLGLVAGSLRVHRSLVVPGAVLAGFLILSGISLANTGNVAGSLRYVFITGYLAVSGAFFASLSVGHRAMADRWIWWGYLAAGLLAAALGWLGVAGAPGFDRFVWGGYRAVAGFKDPNVYGAFLVPAVLFAVHKLLRAEGKAHVAWSVAVGLLVAGQVLSLSRAGWLNMAVALAIYTVFSASVTWRSVARLALGVASAALWIAGVAVLNAAVIRTVSERAGLMSYDQQRFQVQSAILALIPRTPWGIGPGETERVFDYAAHNLYLRVLLENGWLAALSFAVLVGFCLWRAAVSLLRARSKDERSLRCVILAALYGMLVNSAFIDSLHWRHFWLFLGLAAACGAPDGEAAHAEI